MGLRVYLETTVISYLTALPSRDIVQAAHQQVTREWWERRNRFDLFVSEAVLKKLPGETPGLPPAVWPPWKGFRSLRLEPRCHDWLTSLLAAARYPRSTQST